MKSVNVKKNILKFGAIAVFLVINIILISLLIDKEATLNTLGISLSENQREPTLPLEADTTASDFTIRNTRGEKMDITFGKRKLTVLQFINPHSPAHESRIRYAEQIAETYNTRVLNILFPSQITDDIIMFYNTTEQHSSVGIDSTFAVFKDYKIDPRTGGFVFVDSTNTIKFIDNFPTDISLTNNIIEYLTSFN